MKAPAKLNLALVVGPLRDDGRHEVATLMTKLELADDVRLEPAPETVVTGFPEDTLVRRALAELDVTARVHIEKRIPVAAGLAGGSSDAAAALKLIAPDDPDLHTVAARLGSDVPFFLRDGPQVATGAGDELYAVDLPLDFHVVLLLPEGARKSSTAAVYAAFDGADGFDERRAAVIAARDLAALPPNDLARSPFADELRALGAFRADVTGAGPTVYGLFTEEIDARAAAAALERRGRVWITKPAW
jgi:4-diphosphocytidyl-2-C-methyl-D-erythritol kinase